MGRSDVRGNGADKDAGISPEVESQAAELVGAVAAKEEDRPGRRFGANGRSMALLIIIWTLKDDAETYWRNSIIA